MTQKSWTLIDTDSDRWVDELTVGPGQVGGDAKGYAITKCRLRGGLRDGVDVVVIDNGALAVEVVPTRGMGIQSARLGKTKLGWSSPVRGPVHPQWVPVLDPGGLGWLDGFDELLVRCGLESNGAPDFDADGRLKYPLHGRIANRPAHHVAVSVDGETGEIELTGTVEETRFHFAKLRLTSTLITRAGQAGFRVRDEVENFAGTPADIQLLYHINFGPPLLEPGSRVVASVKQVVPRNPHAAQSASEWNVFGPPEAGGVEQVYFCRLLGDDNDRTQVLLKNAVGDLGVSVDFAVEQLPCFTLWKNTVAEADGYVTGLEPGTNFPNPRTFETQQGRVVSLPPGGKATFEVGFTVHDSSGQVDQAESKITELQKSTELQVFDSPQPDWCAP